MTVYLLEPHFLARRYTAVVYSLVSDLALEGMVPMHLDYKVPSNYMKFREPFFAICLT